MGERSNLKDFGINGTIILKYIFSNSGMAAWTELKWLRTRDIWPAVVSAVWKLRVQQNAGNFLTT
jgi:hypothetical protein